MRLYLDTSALVKLYVEEAGSSIVRAAVEPAELVATSALAYVEARAAFARRRREGGLLAAEHRRAVRDFDRDWGRYLSIAVTDHIIRRSATLAESHGLRAYDAVHLASATVVRGELAQALTFASWDAPLERAAVNEGLDALQQQH